jgi:hypothetical protein
MKLKITKVQNQINDMNLDFKSSEKIPKEPSWFKLSKLCTLVEQLQE